MTDDRERAFPLQNYHRSELEKGVKPGPRTIPWSVAEKAYCVYSSQYGTSQSLERLAQRGGFSLGEMDSLYPAWRDEISEIVRLKAEVADLTRRLQEAQRDCMGILENESDLRMLEAIGFERKREGNVTQWINKRESELESARRALREHDICPKCYGKFSERHCFTVGAAQEEKNGD